MALTNTTGVAANAADMEEIFNRSSSFIPPLPKTGDQPLHFQYVRMGWTLKWAQLSMLLHRGLVAGVRDKANMTYTLVKNLWLGVFIGLVFRGVPGSLEEPFVSGDQPTQESDDFAGLLFFILVYIWLSNGQIIPTGVSNSKLFSREMASETYSSDAYWLATILVELPLLLVAHTLFTTLVYFICGGFPLTMPYYGYFWLIYALSNLYAMLWAQFLAYLTRDSLLAFAIYPIMFYILSMFSSYTIRIDNIAPSLRWMSKVTFIRWAFQGVMIVEFGRHGQEGEDVLKSYGFGKFSKEFCIVILLVNIASVAMLFYFALRKSKSKIEYVQCHPVQAADPRNSTFQMKTADRESTDSTCRASGLDRDSDTVRYEGRAGVTFTRMSQLLEDFLVDAAEELEIIPPSSFPGEYACHPM